MFNKRRLIGSPFYSKIENALQEDFIKTDKLMMQLLVLHWITASTVTAFTYGFYLLGFIGGGGVVLIAFLAYLFFRGSVFSRVIMGISIMIFSAIFIQQHLGRIEMHFHIFIGLAFLIRYKDSWAVIMAGVTIALHHLIFAYCQVYDISIIGIPLLVYNYGDGLSITIIHAIFVVIAVGIYHILIQQMTQEFCLTVQMNAELKSNIQEMTEQSRLNAQMNTELNSKNEALADSFQKLSDATEQNAMQNSQNWQKTGQRQLSDLMSGEQEIRTLATNVISFLTRYVEAQVGLFYLLKQDESYLELIASYAYTENENIANRYKIGEGLVGEVALKKKMLSHICTPEEQTRIIQSGLSIAVFHQVMFIPFLYEGEVKGVIEIGVSKTLTTLQQDFLQLVIPNIGIAVNTAESRARMQAVLEKSQQQANELQKQKGIMEQKQKELQDANEELLVRSEEMQAQSEEMQAQSEELQSQQEELRQFNEELQERTK